VVAVALVADWVVAGSVSAPSVDNVFHIAPAYRASKSDARAVEWRWCVKDHHTTKRSKAVAPSVSRRAERRASCQEEIELDRWEQDL
jgi:hypothetical protein